MDPLIIGIWNFWFPGALSPYLLSVGSIFGYLSVATGLVKYFASQDLAEELRIEGEVKTFGSEDVPIVLFYLIAGYGLVVLLGVELTTVTITQTGVMLLLSLSYITIPWYLWSLIELPKETDDLFTKGWVFLWVVIFAVFATNMALVLIRAAEFYL